MVKFSIMKKLLILVLFILTTSNVMAKKVVKVGDTIAVNYIGSLKDGRVFDHNIGKNDLIFTVGDGKMIKPFEDAFIGMKKGEEKTIDILAKDAYGEFDEAKVFSIPAEQLPKDGKVGDTLKYRIGGGFYPVRIVYIGEKEVFIDANPKLAGKDLNFKITLLDIVEKVKN